VHNNHELHYPDPNISTKDAASTMSHGSVIGNRTKEK
jgi:hypothetical protein